MSTAESLSRCVEHMLDEDPGSAPDERELLGEWLAARGLTLATVAEPGAFSMPGAFLARRRTGWAVVFGVPPGVLFDPSDSAGDDEPRLEAAVLVPLELRTAGAPRPDPGTGRVESIAVAASAEGPMEPLPQVRAIAGSGLEGDRYARGAGTFSSRRGSGRALTLVDSEALAELRSGGVVLEPLAARRNLVVSGIDLDALIGRRFRVGKVECFGARRCEPCAHLERLTAPGVLRGLVHRGGLRADLVSGGEISVGDEVAALD